MWTFAVEKKMTNQNVFLLQYSAYLKMFKIAIILYRGFRIVIISYYKATGDSKLSNQNFPSFPMWLLICLISKWLNRKPLLPLNPRSTARTVNFDKQLE